MTKALKHTILGLLATLLAISAACLLTKPAEQAKADSTYTVTFYAKDSQTVVKKFENVPSGTKMSDLDIASVVMPEVEGFEFKNFIYRGASANFDEIIVTSDISIYANYQMASVSVKVYCMDGSRTIKTFTFSGKGYQFGKSDLSMVDTSKTGYTFKGWSRTENGTVEEISEILNSDFTIYAVYEINKYTVTFVINGTTVKTEKAEYNSRASEIDISNVNTNRPGYTFKGWAVSGSNEIVSLADYAITSTVTFNAIYNLNSYTINFVINGTTVKTEQVLHNTKASEIDLTGISLVKDNYTFKGWSLSENGEIVKLSGITITTNTTFYAVYEVNKYSVTFYNGTDVIETITVKYGTKASEINISAFAPSREGYKFKGWSLTNGGAVADLTAVTIDKSTTLFAVYAKITYTVTFYSGETQLKTLTVDYGTNLSAISLTGVSTSKAGYIFRGWSLWNGGAVVNAAYSVKSDTDFYAVYDVEGKATVVFKDGATSLKTVTVDLGTKASEIDLSDLKLEKDGYKFKGWSKTEGGDVVDLETVSVNEYTVLYAVYEKGTNNILDNASEWLTSKTGVAFSATGVLVLALGVYLLLRRK